MPAEKLVTMYFCPMEFRPSLMLKQDWLLTILVLHTRRPTLVVVPLKYKAALVLQSESFPQSKVGSRPTWSISFWQFEKGEGLGDGVGETQSTLIGHWTTPFGPLGTERGHVVGV
mmetsp:Transcript_13809/g.19967  ORF Transcript_13809/g.19967 Transcript_13809/m.19967 type:complete len:115 (-) Transcript_13809:36-380(-)